jgi:hypothetical protein
MAVSHSNRPRHRDLDPTPKRRDPADVAPAADRVFTISDDQREQIAACLRDIDEAAAALERQQNPANRRILRDLGDAADRIYDILNGLEETGD